MSLESFIIHIDRVQNEGTYPIKMSVPPEALDLEEPDFHFQGMIEIQGEAYIASSNLVLHLDVIAYSVISCSICNADAEVPLRLHHFYHVESLDKIRSKLYNFSLPLREEILLEVPHYAECNMGKCPEREVLSQYLLKH